jgi:ABC-2 type transport system ATP-binding protein
MVEADELCGRVAIIDHGRILALDTPRALKRSVARDPVFELSLGSGGTGLEELRGLRGVRSLSHHTHPATGATEVRIVVLEDQVIGEVLGRLKHGGVPVLHLTKAETTLETVFIQKVGRGLTDEAGPDGEPA